ncbi:MAG: penicillin acylase family protein [Vicinamibacterales bacterium]
MKKLVLLLLAVAAVSCAPSAPADPDLARWEQRAANVQIVRDDWGIAHVHGPTDADAVFGMIYAQAEDDFNRIEVNFLNSQGRLAEAEGEAEIYRDLRMKLFIDPAKMQALYAQSPERLRALMDAWADGLNYYLHTHPETHPRVLTRFEPWMALTFSEGSIGGDIERVGLRELEAFYGGDTPPATTARHEPAGPDSAGPRSGLVIPEEPTGSNGFAIAPANSASGHALLWINPHTSFYFRDELQMTSDEGLNAYGAVTWGQFFVYQGFNERAGWMHTSSGVDNIDEYAETIVKKDDGYYYKYGDGERKVTAETITVPYRTASGMAQKAFTIYRTHHGPIVRAADGKWMAVRLMEEPLKALQQSYGRTRARNLAEFRETMELHTNSSNNTVFADADGNIAYFHANFIPVRDPRFDWSKPVDGSDPATEWGEVLSIDDSPNVFNPANGWIQNTNNWPYSAAGPNSPKPADYAPYVQVGGENPRGVHAVRVLQGRTDFTLETLRDAAFDSYLTEFELLVPPLVQAWDRLPAGDPLKARLAEQVKTLRDWDLRWGVDSVPTALAVFYGEELWQRVTPSAREAGVSPYEFMEQRATARQRLEALAAASDTLTADFGRWQTPWGDINRFQRLTGDIVQPFDDSQPSHPVGFTSSRWGSLASFGARPYDGTKKWYGTSGNSFVAAVEFGDRVRAMAVTAGGISGDPSSPHFKDQIDRYASGNLREVYFYPEQLEGHTERTYRPGQK